MDYSNPEKIKTVLEILGVNTEEMGTERNLKHSSTVNQTVPSIDEAKLVVMEILEERISVAIEVSTMIHQSTDTVHQD